MISNIDIEVLNAKYFETGNFWGFCHILPLGNFLLKIFLQNLPKAIAFRQRPLCINVKLSIASRRSPHRYEKTIFAECQIYSEQKYKRAKLSGAWIPFPHCLVPGYLRITIGECVTMFISIYPQPSEFECFHFIIDICRFIQ